MTRASLNDAVWAVSLLLQCALFALVLLRGVGRRLPVFALLLGFYPLRAALLFALFGHIAPAAYAAAYSAFSIVDLVLQLGVVLEIAARLVRGWGGWTPARSWGLVLMVGLSAGAAWIGSSVLPRHVPVPPDRLQMFDSCLLILICAWAYSRPSARILRRVALGFALYGVADLSAMAGRTLAVAHRDGRAYVEWSYVAPAAYLAVVIYWLLSLKLDAEGSLGRRMQVRPQRAAADPGPSAS